MKIISIKFKDRGSEYFFINENLELEKDNYVVVETENGEQYAKVTNIDVKDLKNISKESMKKVLRIATEKDTNKYLKNIKEAKEASEYVKDKVKKMKLNMKILYASYTLDKKQLTFNFTSEERVDFRELVKEIASKYKTRIELHQIGVRDKSRLIGGLGLCGRPLCCSTFLPSMEAISINMAKNQNIALNPTKINGLCGRLLCCLQYEDDVYTENRNLLPKVGQKIKTSDGEGIVKTLNILQKKYTVEINGELKEYELKDPIK